MKYKNYYKILELHNDKASEDDIKTAYRKLAKQYHPDINPDNMMAAEKFKDVNEAYQVLGSEESKRKYDRLHFAYKLKDGFNFKKAKANINTENGFSDFFNMFFGQSITTEKTSSKKEVPIKGENTESEIDASLEEVFFGAEKKLAFRDGTGKLKTIKVSIPKGIRNGEKIRLQGQGKQGQNGGDNGDMYIKVNVIKHDRYMIDGSDIIVDLPLTPWEAALGCKIELPNIDSNILITVPSGVETGEKLRIAGNGYYNTVGGRGDLLANIKIVIPKKLSAEEKELFEKFGEISDFCPRPR